MSENVVDGLSVEYALARLRPIDITLPIWPWARRCIQTKKPMISSTGSSTLSSPSNQLESGGSKASSTPFSLSSSSSVSDRPRSPPPCVTNSVPSSSSPVILPVPVSTVTDLTSPALTRAMKSEYVISSPSPPFISAGTKNTAMKAPAITHGSQRRSAPPAPGRPPPVSLKFGLRSPSGLLERRSEGGSGCGPCCRPRPGGGGGGGGGSLSMCTGYGPGHGMPGRSRNSHTAAGRAKHDQGDHPRRPCDRLLRCRAWRDSAHGRGAARRRRSR